MLFLDSTSVNFLVVELAKHLVCQAQVLLDLTHFHHSMAQIRMHGFSVGTKWEFHIQQLDCMLQCAKDMQTPM